MPVKDARTPGRPYSVRADDAREGRRRLGAMEG